MHVEITQTEAWRPFTAVALRANLRRVSSAEDDLLASFIESSTRYVERRANLCILGRTIRVELPAWFSYLELPASPLRYAAGADPETAVSVSYMDATGAYLAAPSGAYNIVSAAQSWGVERSDADLPDAKDHPRAIRIEATIGYRDATHFEQTAPDLRDAIMLHASHRDSNREATILEPRVTAVSRAVEHGLDALIANHKRVTRYSAIWSELV